VAAWEGHSGEWFHSLELTVIAAGGSFTRLQQWESRDQQRAIRRDDVKHRGDGGGGESARAVRDHPIIVPRLGRY
jgi:hypothetical protein